MLVLVEDAAEAVVSAYVEVGDLPGFVDRFGEGTQRGGCLQ
jgi:hypothetical protein